jgi:hypothetical protein
MSINNEDRNSCYLILEKMKRYYKIDSDSELVKYIKYVKRNHITEPNEVDICNIQRSIGMMEVE